MGLKKLGSKLLFKKSSAEKRFNSEDEKETLEKQGGELAQESNLNSQDTILSNEVIFNELIEKLKSQVNSSLISTAILSLEKGVAIAKHNSDDTNDLYVCSMTKFFLEELKGTSYRGHDIQDYYVIDLKNNQLCLVLLLGDYCWYIIIDKVTMTIGMMLNVVVPNLIEEFNTTLETIRVLNEQNSKNNRA